MSVFSPIYFNHPGFTRLEKAPEVNQVTAYLNSALSRFIVLSKENAYIYAPDNLYLHSRSDVYNSFPSVIFENASLLGFLADEAIFSIVVDETDNFKALGSLNFSLIDRISQPVLAAYIFAKFHVHTRYCQQCGGALHFLDTTKTHLHCGSCKRDIYPTISPCVIFSVFSKDLLLVGLRYGNVFTNFSGFLEVAECAEEAVLREFEEETGVSRSHVKNVTNYQTEEPWGNEYGEESLMLCYSIELSSPIAVEATEEVKQLKWVTLEDWKSAARRTDGVEYEGEHETWLIPKIGTVARWMMEKTWEAMGLWNNEDF